MPTLEAIKAQIAPLDGASRLLGRREINELPNILWDNEDVRGVLQGVYNNSRGWWCPPIGAWCSSTRS